MHFIGRVNGSWGSWGSWGSCNSNTGLRYRYRSCNSPNPKNGGSSCPGSSYSTLRCIYFLYLMRLYILKIFSTGTKIDGNWGSWGAWGTCSKTCGTGTRKRSRSCNNPAPKYGGRSCSGSSSSSGTCNRGACPGKCYNVIKSHLFFSFCIYFIVLDCASGWKYFKKTRKCYKYSSTERTRTDAIKSCKAATDNPTANLVSIRDLDTNNYINTMSSGKFWIGAYKGSSGWTWPDGYKAIFTKWAKDQPSGDGSYMEVLDNTGSWNDLHAGYKRASVCQYDPKGNIQI